MIYTCYSYKGGVGRSMALANIGELLYRRGLRVLMIDFDLEAPGLEQYFYSKENKQLPQVLAQRGILDLLVSYKKLRTLAAAQSVYEASSLYESSQEISSPPTDLEPPEPEENRDGFPYPVEPIENFIWQIHGRGPDSPGELLLMPAGQRNREIRSGGHAHFEDDFRSYADQVRGFAWDDFYINWDGEQFFDWFYDQVTLTSRADVVLIDSRTGVAEMSGVCTYQLADVVIMFVAPNDQNVEGTKKIAKSLVRREDLIKKRYKQRDLSVIFVPSRVDASEKDKVDNLARRFREIDSTLGSANLVFKTDAFTDLTIPYIPYYSFIEELVTSDSSSYTESKLRQAYENICLTLAQLDPVIAARLPEQIEDSSRMNEGAAQNRRAEQVFASLSPTDQILARSLLPRFVRLAQVEKGERKDAPRDIKFDDLTHKQRELVRSLHRMGLLFLIEEPSDEAIVGFAEDGFIQNWDRLRKWIDEDREFLLWRQTLQDSLAEWELFSSPDSLLLRGPKLDDAIRWKAEHPTELDIYETDYVLKSIRRRRNDRIKVYAGVAAIVVALLSVSFGVYDFLQRRKITALQTRSSQLALNSKTLTATQPELGALLALEAANSADTVDAREALAKALIQFPRRTIIFAGRAYCARFSHDGRRIITGGVIRDSDALIWLVTGAKWQEHFLLQGHVGAIKGAAFSPDDTLVATASDDGKVGIWDVESGQLKTFLGPDGPGSLTDVSWSPDGQFIAASARDNAVYVWDVNSRNLRIKLTKFTDDVYSVDFSPDGKYLAAGGKDSQVRVWNAKTWEEASPPLRGHSDLVGSVRFNQSSTLLLTSSLDRTSRVWQVSDWRAAGVLSGSSFATAGSFSYDGKWVVAGSWDRTIRIWEVSTEDRVLSLSDADATQDVSFSPDGKLLVAVGRDGRVVVWELDLPGTYFGPSSVVAKELCSRIPRNMSPTEWTQYMGQDTYRATCTNLPWPAAIVSPSPPPASAK